MLTNVAVEGRHTDSAELVSTVPASVQPSAEQMLEKHGGVDCCPPHAS